MSKNEIVTKNIDYDHNFRISYEGDQIYINGEPSTLNLNSTIAEVIAAQQEEESENELSNTDYFTSALEYIS